MSFKNGMNWINAVPENLKTKKSRFGWKVFAHIYIVEQGKGAVIGRFTGWFSEFALFILLLKSYNVNPTPFWIIVLCVGAILLCYITGYIWLSYSVDRINAQVINERNPLIKNIHDKVMYGKDLKKM